VPPLRFRLRTIMILVAVLAVSMGSIRLVNRLAGISGASMSIDGLYVSFDSVLTYSLGPSRGSYSLPIRDYKLVPVGNIAVLVALCSAALALLSYLLSRRRKRVHALGRVNRPIGRPKQDQSGESEKV
jgi:hypothetical protein